MSVNISSRDKHYHAFTDWFLPSKDELTAMYDELDAHGVGNFTSGAGYLSSSEFAADTTAAWFWIMGGNSYPFGEFYLSKNLLSSKSRAIRSFTSITPSYSLRDIGPAGGLIFWKYGNDYLEAAPFDISFSIWSNIYTGIETTGTAIGTGQANTLAIIGQLGHTTSAAKLCNDLVA